MTSNMYKIKKVSKIRSIIDKTIHNLDFPTVSLAAILNYVIKNYALKRRDV